MDGETSEMLTEVFGLLDKTGEGKISPDDIGSFLRASGLNPCEADVKKIRNELGSEKISFEQAVTQYTAWSAKRVSATKTMFMDVFKVFDRENNGQISMPELVQLLTSLGDPMKEDEVRSIANKFLDHQGNVRYEDLCDLILKG